MRQTFDDKTMVELLELILLGNETSDEAMWYVLHDGMGEALRLKFVEYEDRLWDTYEDLVDDFFLYLREGRSPKGKEVYRALKAIKNKSAFDKWLLSTWRNFLCARVEQEESVPVEPHNLCEIELDEGLFTDEQKMAFVSRVIAYCDQVFLPRGRFIFLRTLLTLFNKKQALPEKQMAEALGMTDINYRVTNHRLKVNVRKFLRRTMNGETLRLDESHEALAEDINANFEQLYPILIRCYDSVLQTLRQRDSVVALRLSTMKFDGTMLHEAEIKVYRIGIRAFWSRFSRELDR